ncbi:MAG: hypothetical protein KF878_12295 [Planctomycetes bacterium]|nr:hypothetical protein [Planctomycetota bacterium]
MSDVRLRELEGRWRQTGAVEDEAAYLMERVRVGDLTQERLVLAASCGHEGALECLGWGREEVSLTRSLERALAVDERVAARFLLEVAGGAAEASGLADPDPLRCLRATEDWLADPSEPNRAAVAAAGRQALVSSIHRSLALTPSARAADNAAALVAHFVSKPEGRTATNVLRGALRSSNEATLLARLRAVFVPAVIA